MSNSEQKSWNKRINVFLIGIAIPVTGILVGIFVPEIRCSLGIAQNSCKNKYCKNLFQEGKRIEFKYRPIKKDHIEVGKVKINQVTDKSDGITVVKGEATLLEHSSPANTNIELPLLQKDHNFPPNKNHKPINFDIKINNEIDKWELLWVADQSLSEGKNGSCEPGKAGIYMDHPTVQKKYQLYFQLIP
ncbi:MAG: hypothetical protein F6K18_05840 [Okeania sp. SIO2C2]|uniref:hypothetical protein n=1 Tax=Okeania sp. SIO2C2 TaxID=2607787 RepID=UPI0013B7FB69|nr:hypothetical protein [Okeania sp. SIO2C2]NEP86381.1 hypothetical protein [Okeania sp. SIO2C2]